MRPIFRITALALLGIAFGVQAQKHDDTATYRYRWVDATGLPHYSDSLSVKALQYGYDVLGPGGRVVRHVPRTATPTERKATAAKLAQQQAARQAAVDQREHDRQLLMAYPTVAVFKAAQQARIDQLDQRMHTTRLNLDSQEQALAQLLGNAADFSRQGKPVPHALGQRIAEQRQTVDAQRRLLKQQQAQRTHASQQVAAKLAHYRELLARQQARYGH